MKTSLNNNNNKKRFKPYEEHIRLEIELEEIDDSKALVTVVSD